MTHFKVTKVDTPIKPPKTCKFGMCKANNDIYLFGGYAQSKLWRFRLNSMNWECIFTNDDMTPEGRQGCTLNYYNDKLYLFGGRRNLAHKNDMWCYDIKLNKWDELLCSKPPETILHNTVVYKNYIILFGGRGTNSAGEYVFYNHIIIYDININEWKLIDTDNRPYPRYWHGMTIIRDNVLVICGGQDDEYKTLNDIWSIDINAILFSMNNSFIIPKWNKWETNMKPIHGQIFLEYNDNILMFGGGNKYSIENNNLTLICNINSPLKSNKLGIFLYGFLKNIENDLNMNIPNDVSILIQHYIGIISMINKISSIKPCLGHNGCIISQNDKKYLFIFGGTKESNLLNHCYMIHLS